MSKRKQQNSQIHQIGDIWRMPGYAEPWRVRCEDCELGFKTENQARSFASRHFSFQAQD